MVRSSAPVNAIKEKLALFISLLITILGLFLIWYCHIKNFVAPRFEHNILFHIFANFEIWTLPLYIIIFFWIIVITWKNTISQSVFPGWMSYENKYLYSIPICVFSTTLLGSYFVTLNYPLSMDEFAMKFMTEIMANFDVTASIPESWRGLVHTIKPIWVNYHFMPHEWTTQYWPVFSLLAVPFQWLGHFEWYPPILATLTILLIWNCGKLIWPGNPIPSWVSVILLATSAQFLITSMTAYAMTGHVFFNVLWLWIYLKNKDWSWLILPWIGIMALGLHQPIPHALFVLPFCIRIARTQPIKRTAYIGIVYLFGCIYWYLWMNNILYNDLNVTARTWLSSFGAPGSIQILSRAINTVYLITWQNPLAFILLTISISEWKNHKIIERDLLYSVIITSVFYFLFNGTGGHGWGARYSHQILANIALLGGFTYSRSPVFSYRVFSIATCISLFLLLPIRSIQVRSFTTPYSKADRSINRTDADFVMIDTISGYNSRDLLRNDPYLKKRPIRVDHLSLTPKMYQAFIERGSCVVFDSNDLTKNGILPVEMEEERRFTIIKSNQKASSYLNYLSFTKPLEDQKKSE